MEIIHWMAHETQGMDLFANDQNKNPPYEPRSPSFREIVQSRYDDKQEDEAGPSTSNDIGEVDVSILPTRTIEVRNKVFHLNKL